MSVSHVYTPGGRGDDQQYGTNLHLYMLDPFSKLKTAVHLILAVRNRDRTCLPLGLFALASFALPPATASMPSALSATEVPSLSPFGLWGGREYNMTYKLTQSALITALTLPPAGH